MGDGPSFWAATGDMPCRLATAMPQPCHSLATALRRLLFCLARPCYASVARVARVAPCLCSLPMSVWLAPAQGERDGRELVGCREATGALPPCVASGEGSGNGCEGEDEGARKLIAGG